MSDGLACVPRHLQTWMAQLSLASPGSSWQSMFSSSFWAVDVAAPRHLPGALFPRAGPREETSLHAEHCALSPGPSLSGHRTTAGNQNVDPCVKMIQNSRWQEQAVQAERGVPVIKQPPVSQEEAPKGPPTSGEAAVCRRAEMQLDAAWPAHLAGADGGAAPPGGERRPLGGIPVLGKDARHHQAAFLRGEQRARRPGLSLPQGLPVLFTDS